MLIIGPDEKGHKFDPQFNQLCKWTLNHIIQDALGQTQRTENFSYSNCVVPYIGIFRTRTFSFWGVGGGIAMRKMYYNYLVHVRTTLSRAQDLTCAHDILGLSYVHYILFLILFLIPCTQ